VHALCVDNFMWHQRGKCCSLIVPVQILPSLLEVLRDVPSRDCSSSLVYLQFIYWSMQRLDGTTDVHQVTVILIIIITITITIIITMQTRRLTS